MSAEIINIWDYRRKEEKLKEQAAEILSQVAAYKEDPEIKAALHRRPEILSQIDTSPSEMIPDGIPYQAPPEDCA